MSAIFRCQAAGLLENCQSVYDVASAAEQSGLAGNLSLEKRTQIGQLRHQIATLSLYHIA